MVNSSRIENLLSDSARDNLIDLQRLNLSFRNTLTAFSAFESRDQTTSNRGKYAIVPLAMFFITKGNTIFMDIETGRRLNAANAALIQCLLSTQWGRTTMSANLIISPFRAYGH